MKRLLNVAVVATVMLTLSSCSGDPQASGEQTLASSNAPTSAPSTVSAPAPADPSPTEAPPPSAEVPVESSPQTVAPVAEPLAGLDLNTRGNAPQTVGQIATFGDATGEKFADLQAVKIQRNFICTAQGASPSINGEFVALEISITVHSNFPDSGWPHLEMSNTDFKAWNADGERVEDPVGNSAGCVAPDQLLPSSLDPGKSATGLIILDLPANASSASYAIGGFEGSYGWEWSW